MRVDLSNDMTWRQMIGVGVRRVVLARGELDRLEGPGYAARRTELRRKAKEAARTRDRQAAAPQDEANLCHPKSRVSLQIHKMSHLQRILLQTSVQMIVLTSTHLPLRSMRMLASRTCTLSSVRTRTVPIPEPTMPLAPGSHPPTMRVMPAVL